MTTTAATGFGTNPSPQSAARGGPYSAGMPGDGARRHQQVRRRHGSPEGPVVLGAGIIDDWEVRKVDHHAQRPVDLAGARVGPSDLDLIGA